MTAFDPPPGLVAGCGWCGVACLWFALWGSRCRCVVVVLWGCGVVCCGLVVGVGWSCSVGVVRVVGGLCRGRWVWGVVGGVGGRAVSRGAGRVGWWGGVARGAGGALGRGAACPAVWEVRVRGGDPSGLVEACACRWSLRVEERGRRCGRWESSGVIRRRSTREVSGEASVRHRSRSLAREGTHRSDWRIVGCRVGMRWRQSFKLHKW